MATDQIELSNIPYEEMQLTMDLTSQTRGEVSIFGPVNEQVNSKALSVLSLTACLNLIAGPIFLYKGVEQINLAQKLKDHWGVVQGALNTVYGGLQTAAGAVYAPASAFMLALLFTVSKTLSVASTVLTTIGGGILGVASALRLVKICIGFGHAFHLRKSLKTPEEALKSLLTNPHLWNRVVGPEMALKLKQSDPIQARACLEEIKKAVNKEIGMQLLEMALTVAVLTLTILSFVLTGGMAPLILGITSSVLGVSYLLLDLSSFRETLKGEPGKFDKVFIWITAILTTALTALGLVLAVNPIGIAITAISTFIVLLINIACLAAVYAK